MEKNKVLIIGGNGFLGANICRHLVRKGYDVYSFDIARPEKKEIGITYIKGDFFDDVCLQNAIKGMDLIIHSLSTVNPGNSNQRYMQGYSRDFVQTVKLCSMIIDTQTQFIFLSSGGTVYGNQEHMPVNEDCFPLPINHYGSVKLCIESVIRTFNTQLHKKMRIARISNPYGPGQDYLKGVGFVDAAIKKALKHETIEIWGDGEVVRDYIYIDDVCKMIEALISYQGDIEVFNISSCEAITPNIVLENLREFGLEVDVVYKAARSVDVPKIVLDNSRIKAIYKEDILSFTGGIKKYLTYLATQED